MWTRLLLLLLAVGVQAQNSTSAPSSSAAAEPSLITSATASATSSATGAWPTANSTSTATGDLTLWVPEELVECERATFAFHGPPVSKTVGVYVTDDSVFLEQIMLGDANRFTTATFGWTVDVPAGLSLNVQIYANYNGRTISFTSEPFVVKAGSSMACLATNEGQNTHSILSLASSIDPAFTHAPSTTAAPRSSTHAGPIAGGVVGGVFALTLLFLVIFFLRRRRQREKQHLTAENVQSLEMASRPTLAQAPSYYSASGKPTLVQGAGLQYPGSTIVPTTPPPRIHSTSPRHPPQSPGAPGTEGLDDPSLFLERSQRGRQAPGSAH